MNRIHWVNINTFPKIWPNIKGKSGYSIFNLIKLGERITSIPVGKKPHLPGGLRLIYIRGWRMSFQMNLTKNRKQNHPAPSKDMVQAETWSSHPPITSNLHRSKFHS